MTAVYTSITLSYLAKARALARSVRRCNPDYRFYLVLAEPAPQWLSEGIAAGREPFDRLIAIDDLPIENCRSWLFEHDIVEACTGVKGPALKLLQEKFAEERVIYLDPDIVVFHSLAPIAEMLRDHSIVLTPHCSNAEHEVRAIVVNEISSLAHGVYNLGFLAVASDSEGRRLADWWSHRLYHFCHDDIPRGLFTDQRWMDLVPTQFDGVKILRDAAYNVASWNVTQRHVSGSVPDELLCDGRPLCFYHYSGMNSNTPHRIHRAFVPENRTLVELVHWYEAECDRLGEREFRGSPWHFAVYEDGMPITRQQRLFYRNAPEIQERFPDPFAVGEGSFYEWLSTEGPGFEQLENMYPQSLESLQAAASRLRQIVSSRPYKVYAKLRRFVRAA
jgi:lipopolysaccharide biosynthesis glycosyltransferase